MAKYHCDAKIHYNYNLSLQTAYDDKKLKKIKKTGIMQVTFSEEKKKKFNFIT